jgi:hypothetical protein
MMYKRNPIDVFDDSINKYHIVLIVSYQDKPIQASPQKICKTKTQTETNPVLAQFLTKPATLDPEPAKLVQPGPVPTMVLICPKQKVKKTKTTVTPSPNPNPRFFGLDMNCTQCHFSMFTLICYMHEKT